MTTRRAWRAVGVAGLLAFGAGCGGGDATVPPPDPRTPGQHFADQQAGTVTPYGRVAPGSVSEADGRINFGTEDGSRWKVDYGKRADGTYEYGTPEPAKK